jgi:predicted enzyme related to lactoylglutathione lyase
MAPSSSTLRVSYVSFFTRSVVTLPSFYVDVFGLSERQASRSERYRELELGDLRIGFPYIDAYAMLNMSDQADPTGSRTLLTFAAEDPAAVERLTRDAVAHGARLVKGPFSTNFGQFLSVILDPEGNALRISAPAAA